MRRLAIMTAAAAAFFITSCSNSGTADKKEDSSQSKKMDPDEMVKRGNYLVTVASCNDCHSPKKFNEHGFTFDSSRLLSGHQAGTPINPIDGSALKPGSWMLAGPDLTTWVGPWGISYSANLTPDSATGLGAWNEDAFMRALRTGKHQGQDNGRPIMPPMPWELIGRMTDDDLRSVFAYLRTLTPVSNRVPGPVPPPQVQVKK